MKLYIWDDAVIVVAASIEAARVLAIERLGDLRSIKEMVMSEQPKELEAPCLYVIWQVGVTS